MVAEPLADLRFLDALAAWLLTYALHSTVLIAAAWLAAVGLARMACGSQRLRDALPSIRERLWKLALLGGLATAGAQTLFGLDPWGLQLALRSNLVTSVPQPAPVTALLHVGGARSALDVEPLSETLTAAAPSAWVPVLRAAGPAPAAETLEAATWTPSWIQILLALWAAGVVFGLARWACQWNRLLRNLDDRKPIESGHVYEIFQHLRLRSKTRVAVSLAAAPGIQAPITLGLRRFEICLPPRVATELQHDEIGALLAHELAHAERRDPRWVIACRAIEVVFFFQPLNKLCAHWLSDEAEYLCDDRAVVQIGERVALASCLTEIAGWIVHSPPTRLAPGMAAPGTRLSLRVGRLLDEDHDPNAPRTSAWLTAALAPAALSVAVFVPGVVAEAREPRIDPETTFDSELCERTHELEVALQAAADCPEPAPPPPADASASEPSEALPDGTEAPPAVAAAPPGGASDVLDELESQLEAMRDDLADRLDGELLASRLDAIEGRLAALRDRESDLQNLLDHLDELSEVDAAPEPFSPPTASAPSATPTRIIPMFQFQTKD